MRGDRTDKGGADRVRTKKGTQTPLWPEADRGALLKTPGSGALFGVHIPGRGHSGCEGPHVGQGLGRDGDLVRRGKKSILRGGQGFSTSSPLPRTFFSVRSCPVTYTIFSTILICTH